MEIKDILHKYRSNIWFWNGIHSLLGPANARRNTDIQGGPKQVSHYQIIQKLC